MGDALALLPADARAAVKEEEALLVCVRAALEAARQRAALRASGHRVSSEGALRSLRDEAARASEADLPALLHDLSVQHRLAARPPSPRFPDPRTPYIAHLRLDEGRGAEDFLLGYTSFFDTAGVVRIIDWRVAPVARIFYRYREGDRYEEAFPGRVAEGSVTARRIVVIENGLLTRIIGDGLVLERDRDGNWRMPNRAALSLQAGGAGTAARPGLLGVGIGTTGRAKRADVTALLDADQYAAVSATPDRPLLVLGSAGSGKTTVALHRIARIGATDPLQYPLSAAKVVIPEEGLARLARRLLEPLRVGPEHVQTAATWSTELARQVFGSRIRLCVDSPPLVSSLKRHPALYHMLADRFGGAATTATKLARLRRRLSEAYTDRRFLEAVVAASAGDLPKTAVEETVRHTMRQLEESLERQLASIVDAERKRAIDGRALAEGTPDEVAGTLDLEDLPILLYLRSRASSLDAQPISLLVLDEAEDLSLFELCVLGRLLREPCSVTLAGDEAQQTASSFAGWQAALAALGVSDAETCRLPTTYRCPRPVAELARKLLGPLAPEAPTEAAREGAPIGLFRMPSEGQAHLFLAGALRDLVEREPGASVGVIAADGDAAGRVHALVAELPEARLVLHGEFTFEPGIDVTDVDNVKGLEFDYVVVPDATASAYPMNNEARRRLHVAVTRASHQLWIIAGGSTSPLLPAQ
ncbi:MAG TPA: ATP-binding domain-containing protein [Candidatus Binatia bacterium]|nr:ATP-binding domain-containing protein [Candidatus Binatia bacterium]